MLHKSFTGVRVVHHNNQGLLSKSVDFQGDCVGSASVFCFTKTWMKPEIHLPCIPGYQAFHLPFITCEPGVAHGYLPGSCLFISNTLLPKHFSLCVNIENLCVSLNVSFCLLTCQHYKIAIASTYISPSTDVSQCLEDLYSLLSQFLLSVNMFCLLVILIFICSMLPVHERGVMIYLLIFNLFNIFRSQLG